MRGISTAPIVLAIVVVGIAAAVLSYQWFYAQQKASEAAALLSAKVAEDQARCLGAVATGNGTVVVGGREYVNYTGLGCYVDRDIVIVVQWTRP
jgi:hypothetical protein